MFANWYAKIAPLKLTYKSKIITLSDQFISIYLKADGMHQPEYQDVNGLSEEEQAAYYEEITSVRQQISECLANEFTTGCLVKMNWSSTIDAEFITQTIECTTADEVFLQLKASSNISDDIHEPFDP